MFRQIVEPVKTLPFHRKPLTLLQIDKLSAQLRNARRCLPSEDLTCSTSGCVGTEKVSG
jgi:hypothetical protein